MSRIALVVLIGGVASACSSDTMRFADNPFANPFSTSAAAPSPEPAQAAPPAVAAVPTAPVQTAALPPLQAQPAPAVRAASAPTPAVASQGGWSAAGGTPITVGAGDDLNGIARRYGVPAQAILTANGLSSAAQVTAGRQITIPVFSATAPAAKPAPRQVAAAAPQAQPQPKFRLVEGAKSPEQPAPTAAGKTRTRPGMVAAEKKSDKAPTQVAAAPAVTQKTSEKPAEKAAEKVADKPVEKKVAEKPAEKPAEARIAVARVEAPVAKPAPEPAKAPEPDQTASLSAPSTDFRWPARGRVIAGFGANGGNEGINIALPEGTPVKAAEAGTVTYAGNEVKGYGNLVLIRHDNGYISAYAHNGDLTVKRGERVKRGQVVAKSGQTGNVTSPQLHFEIRKGQTPVDPISHLSGS